MFHDGKKNHPPPPQKCAKMSQPTLERAEMFRSPPQLHSHTIVLTCIFEVELHPPFDIIVDNSLNII